MRSDTAGTAYIVILRDGSDAPAAATVKAARSGAGGVLAKGSMEVTDNSQASVSLSGFQAGTAYDAYIVVESNTGTFSPVTKINVNTLSAPSITAVG